ncbi:unnamed protein product [Tetraodon nigroviridis]|uniref:(spotted green pufferfish) hypothetical protein n=1 Tax=Tetraodon nigroviridis TaxID=99883 RepID=Q4RRA0_TETNG|nr:unnamed protein product [Tetraodon nigroviridis]
MRDNDVRPSLGSPQLEDLVFQGHARAPVTLLHTHRPIHPPPPHPPTEDLPNSWLPWLQFVCHQSAVSLLGVRGGGGTPAESGKKQRYGGRLEYIRAGTADPSVLCLDEKHPFFSRLCWLQ